MPVPEAVVGAARGERVTLLARREVGDALLERGVRVPQLTAHAVEGVAERDDLVVGRDRCGAAEPAVGQLARGARKGEDRAGDLAREQEDPDGEGAGRQQAAEEDGQAEPARRGEGLGLAQLRDDATRRLGTQR